jgi:hypothetical protein
MNRGKERYVQNFSRKTSRKKVIWEIQAESSSSSSSSSKWRIIIGCGGVD